MEIINAIISSASLYNSPNDQEGYGLANFYKADSLLTLSEDLIPSLNLYPNPSNGEFTIELYSANNTTVTINIYDILGKSLYFSTENLSRFDRNKILIPNLKSSGVILVSVNLGEIVLTSKLDLIY
tara:strand:- start:267 stop:644 length:378 start_codon:yes stop_codon:yes gene_type:complete